MQEQLEVCQKMALVRNRGLVNARDLGHEVERLSDWREHVRAHPIPVVVAVAALSFWLVPSLPARPRQVQPRASQEGLGAADLSPSDQVAASNVRPTQRSSWAGLRGAAMGFVGTLVGNAVRSYVNEQLQTLIHTRGNHGVQNQRPAPTYRG